MITKIIRIESLVLLARDDANSLKDLGLPLQLIFIRQRIDTLVRFTSPHLVEHYKPVYEALYARAMLSNMDNYLVQ